MHPIADVLGQRLLERRRRSIVGGIVRYRSRRAGDARKRETPAERRDRGREGAAKTLTRHWSRTPIASPANVMPMRQGVHPRTLPNWALLDSSKNYVEFDHENRQPISISIRAAVIGFTSTSTTCSSSPSLNRNAARAAMVDERQAGRSHSSAHRQG